MATIGIYRAGVLKETVSIDEKTVFFRKLMTENRITSEFNSATVLDIMVGDYITWNSEQYTINRLPTIEKLSTLSYNYNIIFESYMYDLSKKLFISIDGLAEFSLNETATGFLNKIISNINKTQTGWSGSVTGDTGKYITLQFSNETCRAALSRIAQAFLMEWGITGKAITLKTTVGTALAYTFEYGRDNGLYKLERQQVSDQNVVTKVFGFGSTKNIPSTYRGGAKRLVFETTLTGSITPAASTTVTGVGTLFLTELYIGDIITVSGQTGEVATIVSDTELTILTAFEVGATDTTPKSGHRYLTKNTDIYGIIEGQFTDENIFPSWPGVVTAKNIVFNAGVTWAVSRVDKVVKNSTPGDCTVGCNGFSYTMVWNTDVLTTLDDFMTAHSNDFGAVSVIRLSIVLESYLLFYASVPGVDFAAATITAGAGTATNITPNVEGAAGSTDFNAAQSYVEDSNITFDIMLNQIIGEPVPKIVFTSGDLSGIELEIYKFDFLTKRIYFNAYTDADGYVVPRYNGGSPVQPEIGDTYVFVNITMPQDVIDLAEAELMAATQVYLNAASQPQVIYTVDIDPKYALANTIDDIVPGDTVEIVDTDLIGVDPVAIRIASLEYPLVNQYKIKAVISDTVPYTFDEQIVKTVVNNTLNNIFSELRVTELIRESELRQNQLISKFRKEIITLTDELPIITNYQSLYAAVHGEHPVLWLVVTIDAENAYISMQNPLFTYVNGLIDTISYDTGGNVTGFIILN